MTQEAIADAARTAPPLREGADAPEGPAAELAARASRLRAEARALSAPVLDPETRARLEAVCGGPDQTPCAE